MSKVIIAVASHKAYPMPQDEIYMPVFAGAASGAEVPEGFTPDNTGDNISELNPFYCELTALYWAWKNLDSDYTGLAHYRRHFTADGKTPVTIAQVEPFTAKVKVFTPKKRRYYIETLYSHYAHTFDASHLDSARGIIEIRCPEYLGAFDCALGRRWGYMFNMMIMERALLDSYCEWLFGILPELRKRVDESTMSPFEKRYPGRVAELLFNVWLLYQLESGALSKEQIKELPVMSTEKVNWLKKGTAFLKAKFLGKKYDKSF